jgi:hypothetical protein
MCFAIVIGKNSVWQAHFAIVTGKNSAWQTALSHLNIRFTGARAANNSPVTSLLSR